jgi:hypothetical protein
VVLVPHDQISIEGIPDRDEHAAIDYLEIIPAATAARN